MSRDDTSFDSTESDSDHQQPSLSFIPTQQPQSDNETPTLSSDNFKKIVIHRIYMFFDTAMLMKISQNVYSAVTNDHVSLLPKQSQHRVRVR